LSRAFTKENDDRATGSVVDRFYQAILGLSDQARDLVGRRQQRELSDHRPEVEAARDAALAVLGNDSYRETFDFATQRAGGTPNSPTWWAIGDAAVAIAARRRLNGHEYQLLIGPLAVALPWLREGVYLSDAARANP
jgi:hypothetical protein